MHQSEVSNNRIGSTVSNDLSASREGYIPLFVQEKCINCGLCDTTCPDMGVSVYAWHIQRKTGYG